jgi:zinc transporter ZupT
MNHLALSGCTIMNLGLQQTLQHAVDHGIEAYITSRKASIPGFIDRHFAFRGALALHRKTFGRDVYKHPVNLLWGLPVALVQGAAELLDKAGAHRTAQWLRRVPRGMPTVLHKELQWLIYTDLLELPYAQESRAAHRDALLEHILAEPQIAALCEEYLTHLHSVAERPAFRAALERHLEEYGKTRGAVSELAGSLLNLAAGYAALSKATPGALSAGTAAATAIAQHLAITNFWLGATVGAWYYGVFPVSASAGLVAATTSAILAAVGVVTALVIFRSSLHYLPCSSALLKSSCGNALYHYLPSMR